MSELSETMTEIEQNLDEMVKDTLIEPEHRDTAKLLLYAMNFGCKNIDELAFRSKLSRDSFVRPRARRMRASGIWTENGKIQFEYADGPVSHLNIEFVLHVACAEGLIECLAHGDKPTPAGLVATKKPTKGVKGNRDQLFAWRCLTLPSPTTVEILVESLTVEALSSKNTPREYERDVVAFRHLTHSARLAAARRWLERSPGLVEVVKDVVVEEGVVEHVPSRRTGV